MIAEIDSQWKLIPIGFWNAQRKAVRTFVFRQNSLNIILIENGELPVLY
jgi:hypothetical protein